MRQLNTNANYTYETILLLNSLHERHKLHFTSFYLNNLIIQAVVVPATGTHNTGTAINFKCSLLSDKQWLDRHS